METMERTKPLIKDADFKPDTQDHVDFGSETDEAVAPVPPKEFKIVDDANYLLKSDVIYAYPFNELAVGQGLFIPVEPNNTLEKLAVAIHRQVDQFRHENSQIERNEDGDEVFENVTIRGKVRHRDGTVKLDPDGNPKLTANSTIRPKLIGPSFAVKAVRKDDEISKDAKSEADGVLVIRLD